MHVRIPIGTTENDMLSFITKMKEYYPSQNDEHFKRIWIEFNMNNIIQVICKLETGELIASMIAFMYNGMVEQFWRLTPSFINDIPNIYNSKKQDINNKIFETKTDKLESYNIDSVLKNIAIKGVESLNENDKELLKIYKNDICR